jgi:NAD(P)-dependent dehydrogenase (short-subunit alcohol dehydrogenase family)
MDIEGHVGVVTGAGSGLGAALARRLAAAGMQVAVADIARDHADRIADEIRTSGGRATAFEVDIGSEASIEALAESVDQALGPCQILCANVGVQQFGTVEKLTRADWEWVYDVNVFGAVATTQVFLPQLRRAGPDPRILVTTSTSALYPASHMAAYVSSKYALLGFAETLRLELAHEGIGVTALLPGPMATTHLQSSAAAKPDVSSTPVFTPDSIAVVAREAGGETIDPDHATRNVLDDLAANRPYTITHPVHREVIEARYERIREAFERAKR